MKTLHEAYDVVVCGGGLAGFCAAVAAARHGARTCLVQDRPMFGGNSSSEVRVPPHGAAAFHAYARETGILSELLIEERARNHETIFENGWTNSVWDLALYDLAMRTPNLSFHVNTAVIAVRMEGERVDAAPLPDEARGYLHRAACAGGRRLSGVIARVGGAELELEIAGGLFIDATGDGVVADLAGCEWRMGAEGRGESGEYHAPETPGKQTMGNSIHFRARDMGRPVPFKAPAWAVKHEDAAYFYDQGRLPKDVRGGYWWLEIGVPWDTIYNAEEIRHELTRHALGVWDWIKNKDPRTQELAANWALDWIGQVPGKRESRRVVGLYLMTEDDIQRQTVFHDEVAFGGWFLDLHTPGGLLAASSEPLSTVDYKQTSDYAVKSYVGPYGIPLRALIARDVPNLMLAGRNVSVSRAALGTVRVMGTTALMGQAAGTAAAVAIERRLALEELPARAASEIQQRLLRDGCFLPSARNEDPADLARTARVTASSEATFSGAGPETRGHHEGMTIWRDQAQHTDEDRLTARRGQWIAVGREGRIDSLAVCLTNPTGAPQTVEAWLMPVETIWDYRVESGAPLAATTLQVPPGESQWVAWPVGLELAPGRYVRLDLGVNPRLTWHSAGDLEPGHLSAYALNGERMRRYGNGLTMSFRVAPAQSCFGPENALSGVTRPHRFTNLWRSDPALPLPQWLELEWPRAQTIAQVELVFPGHLVREYHAYGPFYRDPQCPRDYSVAAWIDGGWREVVRVSGNYQRQRRHALERAVTTPRLRVTVGASGGDPAAAIYEVRCYEEKRPIE